MAQAQTIGTVKGADGVSEVEVSREGSRVIVEAKDDKGQRFVMVIVSPDQSRDLGKLLFKAATPLHFRSHG